jgi:alpha-mannosidase
MKKFSKLVTLFPCHSLEDFPTHGDEQDAKSLLSGWTGLWHPALIAESGSVPQWHRASNTASNEDEVEAQNADYIHDHYYEEEPEWTDSNQQPPSDFDEEEFRSLWQESLITIPKPAVSAVSEGFRDAVASLGATVVEGFGSRNQWLDSIALESKVPDELVADFFSLGYARLQVELMTRKLRYSSDLDPDRFNPVVLEAANAAVAGNADLANKKLTAAFDLLAEEKNSYYSVPADLVDIVLVADSTKPDRLAAELQHDQPVNFLVSGSKLRQIQQDDSDCLGQIAAAVEAESACVFGGVEHELPDNLLSPDSILNQLLQARGTFTETIGQPTSVFMRRRYGLNPLLPGILSSLGVAGAMHVTLDRGRFPQSGSSNIRWSGIDGASVMASSSIPLNAAAEKSFLDLGVTIGSELDSEHVSTVFFARWPGQTCDSFEDVRNASKFGSVIGVFEKADCHFEQVYDPGYGESFDADDYETPWFEEAIGSGSTNPISTVVNFWTQWYRLAACRSLVTMLALHGKSDDNLNDYSKQIQDLQNRVELSTRDWNSSADAEAVGREIGVLIDALKQRFTAKNSVVLNTAPFRSRQFFSIVAESDSGSSGSVRDQKPVCLGSINDRRADLVVEQSGFGVGKIETDALFVKDELAKDPHVDDGDVLRNEFFEVRMDRQTGGVKGVHFYGKRGNLFSQQLAMRQVEEATKKVSYSRSVCRTFEVRRLSRIASEIHVCGDLRAEDESVLATFEQTVRVCRGRPVIDVEMALDPVNQTGLEAGNYFASRLAWAEDSAALFRDTLGARQPVRRPSIEATHFVEVVQTIGSVAMLCHGLPWHRRASKRMMDTVLIAGAEQQRRFRFGFGVNLQNVSQAAIAEMHPTIVVDGSVEKSDSIEKPNSVEKSNSVCDAAAWWMHLANRNLVASCWEPVFDDDCRCTGIRVRLQEVAGNSGTLKLYCRRSVAAAEKENFLGDFERDFPVSKDNRIDGISVVEADFTAWEFFQLHLKWT